MMLARYDNVGCILRMQCHGVDGHNLQVVDGEINGDDLCPFYAQRHRQSCWSGFTTLSPVRHWSSTAMVLLLEGLRSHKVLVIGEYGRHEGLFGSSRRSVTPYVHG
jgi:ABC-type transporter Mla MlaB component